MYSGECAFTDRIIFANAFSTRVRRGARETFVVPFNCVSGLDNTESTRRDAALKIFLRIFPAFVTRRVGDRGRARSISSRTRPGLAGRPPDNVRMYVIPRFPRRPAVIEYSIGFAKAGRAAPCRAAWASRSTGHTPIFDPRQKLRGGSTTDTARWISNGR